MIISDLNFEETPPASEDLQGGADWAATLTAFNQFLSMIQTGAVSGPNGSSAFANIGRSYTSTLGFSTIGLGINNPNFWQL
ncbi:MULTISPECIES: hypothetical protein [Leptolyngbya]|jgi:hypothetical protein|uniref:Uncharacterized protein n=1 Tax=Leptolyngbya boryana NIES-2135 TaxID=1973484 RepID=A0A1Z4JE27_LEPBY|nr:MULTISPECIES: hypothetical protein [Leptolyngbya]BAY55035.1 hypothetical protein NIES2135_18560 [Leptolyngbya boryana NIES-2135]MBD2366015.1 hypothetical protein [Leptolyngbya sp. FACHB-161]MBD2372195.1 hypothetical protein [Leptolyngbya sp. FACHB-238]MBD2396618.1 hypothetical protein [Leptolyngbya sp. FACHB-239]MBD2403141.1 hypothetical protein [Leptolyngbya sp. FACHB-402]